MDAMSAPVKLFPGPDATAADSGETAPAAEDEKTVAAFVSLPDILRQNKPRRPIPTGVEWIDANTGGGLSPGETAIVGGGPGTVKTTLITNTVERMSGPSTALCVIAWDELWGKVAQKTGAQFGERYADLVSDHPEAIARLEARLAQRDAFIRFVDPASGLAVEDIAETFHAIAPKERTRVYFVDLVQLMESKDRGEDDTEQIETRRVVEALLRVARVQEAIIFAISEATKAAISLEAVTANPLAVFATSRKIASRFDLPIAMAKVDDLTVVALAAKNRLGPSGTFRLRLDPSTWRLECLTEAAVEAENIVAGDKKLRSLALEAVKVISERPGQSGSALGAYLRAVPVKFSEKGLFAALALLDRAGFVVADDGPRKSKLWKLARGVNLKAVEEALQ
jgi:KaiC/GvpD/RAD55 family RecA-like ATPase